MTIVAAMSFEDHFLIAADSKVGQLGLTWSTCKLYHIAKPPLAWGFAGELGVGREFSDWLSGYNWKPDIDWYKLRDDSAIKLGELNKKHRHFITNSGSRPTKKDLTSVLIVGYINEIPEILQIAGTGDWRFHKNPDNFAAIGTGDPYIQVVRYTLEMYWEIFLKRSLVYDVETFKFIVERAVERDPDSGFSIQNPMQMWKVMKDEVILV